MKVTTFCSACLLVVAIVLFRWIFFVPSPTSPDDAQALKWTLPQSASLSPRGSLNGDSVNVALVGLSALTKWWQDSGCQSPMRVTPAGARDFGMSFVPRRQSIGHIAVMAHCTEARCGALLPSERAAISALGARVGRYFNATYDVFDDRVRTKFAACNPRGNPNLLACAAHVVQFLGANARTMTVIDLHAAWLADRALEPVETVAAARMESSCLPFDRCVEALASDGLHALRPAFSLSEEITEKLQGSVVVQTPPIVFDGIRVGPVPHNAEDNRVDASSRGDLLRFKLASERCRLQHLAEFSKHHYSVEALARWRPHRCGDEEDSTDAPRESQEAMMGAVGAVQTHRVRLMSIPIERFPVFLALAHAASQVDATVEHSGRLFAELLTLDYKADVALGAANNSAATMSITFKSGFQCGLSWRVQQKNSSSGPWFEASGADETNAIRAQWISSFAALDNPSNFSNALPPFWQYRARLSASQLHLPTAGAPVIAMAVKFNQILLRPAMRALVDAIQRHFRRAFLITEGRDPANVRFHPFPKGLSESHTVWSGLPLLFQTDFFRRSAGMLFLHVDAFFVPRQLFSRKSLDDFQVAATPFRRQHDHWVYWQIHNKDASTGELPETGAQCWSALARNLHRFVAPQNEAIRQALLLPLHRRWNAFADIFYIPRRAFAVATAIAQLAAPHPLTVEAVTQQLAHHVAAFGEGGTLNVQPLDFAGSCCALLDASVVATATCGHKWNTKDNASATIFLDRLRHSFECPTAISATLVAAPPSKIFDAELSSTPPTARRAIEFWTAEGLVYYDAGAETCQINVTVEGLPKLFAVRALLSNFVHVLINPVTLVSAPRPPIEMVKTVRGTLITPNVRLLTVVWSRNLSEEHELELGVVTGVAAPTKVSMAVADGVHLSLLRSSGSEELCRSLDCRSAGFALDDGDDVLMLTVPRGWAAGEPVVDVVVDTALHRRSHVVVLTRGNFVKLQRGTNIFP